MTEGAPPPPGWDPSLAPDPTAAYVADREALPEWQRETDADVFERMERET